jgi:hypothetical protein
MAEESLADESSVFYQVFINSLKKSKARYHEEQRSRGNGNQAVVVD